MKSQVLQRIIRRLAPLAAIVGFVPAGQAQFVHPGCLSVQADFNRMATNVVAGNHPWVDSYNNLCAYSQAQTNWGWAPVPVIYRCGSGCTNNFSRSQQDALAIYYNALRYRITGDVNFANHAIQGMDAWSGTCTNVSGDSNWALAAGLCGYEFACAGEELRGYSGWSPTSINNYSNFLENVFIAGNLNFLINHNGTCDTHYRCNWDACNMASLISCSVFCDDTNNFNQAIAYYTNGIGNGNIFRAVDFVHPDGLGQEEESGRDQAHTMDGVNSLSTFCQVAWNQGVDMYGYDHNRYLRILEYVAKANIFSNTWVPYVHHRNCLLTYDEASLAGAPIGIGQYFWETPAAHYVNVAGLAAPWTAKMAAASRPDSGIANWNSPDWFGFTTLTSYRGPATNGVAAPGDLTATVKGAQITLNWWGTALATSYNVKRAAVSGGPYTTIAVTGPDNLSYVDTGLAPGTAYYYVVSANQPGGESANSTELATAPNDLIAGAVIGSPGSYNNTGATIVNAFDNSFETFYDATNASGDWTGIDPGLGASSVGCVITRIEYAPRPGFAGRMVGGEFQGALDGDPGFANPITLYTVTNQPADGFVTAQNGVLTSVPVNDSTAVRYLRYLGPANGSCNVSIINFHGSRSGLALPSAPANISAATPSYKEVSLSWSASAGATSYTVKRATNGAGPYLVMENLPGNDLTALNSNTNWSDSSAVANTTYYYVIAALNDAGETDSAQTTVTTPAMVVPAGLAAIPGDTQVTLSWAGTGAPSYNVNRATVSGGPYTTITNVTGNGFADIGVSNGMTYYYVVCAVDGGSQSANSAEVRAVPAVQTAISINFAGGSSNNGYPSPMASTEKAGVTASANWNNASGASGTAASLAQDDGTATTAAVSWSANNTWSTPITERPGNDRMMKGYLDTSATSTTTVTVSNLPSAYTSGGYNVYVYCDGDNGSSTKTGIYTMGGMTIDSLDQGGANFAGTFIEASNSAGNFLVFPNQAAAGFTLSAQGLSTDSGPRGPINAIQIVALPAASSAPASPTALNAAGGNAVVNLGWTQSVSPGITGNNVYRSTSGSGGPYNLLANLAATTSYSDTAVGAGSTYYYSVTAINGNGESAPSAYAGAITIPAAPTGLGATAGNNHVALSWTASTGASSYNVKRSTISGGPYTTLTNVTGTSFTDTTAVNGTTYYYVVSALNNSGESGDSTQAGATPSGPAAPAAPTGLKATAQKQAGKIKLAWTQSTSANVTTNNVYEATVSGGPYSRIASIAATTNYLASGLVSGTTYYYVVTAVNSSGLESPDSNQASATAK